MKQFLHRPALLTIYYSLVHCYLSNNLLIWGHEGKSLFPLQKKAIRAICNSHYLAHTTPLFQSLKVMKLEDLYHLQLLKFYYKYENNVLPVSLSELPITQNSVFHCFNTRNRNKLSIPKHRLSRFRKGLVYNVIQFINKVDPSIVSRIYTHSLQTVVQRFKNETLKLYTFTCTDVNCYSCRSF